MAQVTWKGLVGERVVEAMGRSARARGLIADVLRDLRSPELVADAESLTGRAQRAEGMLTQASRLLEEAASFMAAAWHIATRAAAAIRAPPPPCPAPTGGEVQRLRSGLGHIWCARESAEKASRYAEDSRGELCAASQQLLLHRPDMIHLLVSTLDYKRRAAIRCLEVARKLELESVTLAGKAADYLS